MSGGGMAYKQLGKLDDSTGQAMNNLANIEAQKRRDEKLAKEREQVRQQKKDEKLSSSLDNIEIPIGKMINQKTADDATMNFIQDSADKASNYKNEARKALANHDYAKFHEYEEKAKKIRNAVKQYNELLTPIGKQLEEYQKNADKYNPYDKRYKFTDAMLKNNYYVYVNEEGHMRALIGLDKDKDGKILEEEKAEANKYIRGGQSKNPNDYEVVDVDPHDIVSGYYNQFKKVDTDKIETTLANKFGTKSYDKITGNFIISHSGWNPENDEKLVASAKAIMEDPETRAWILNTKIGIHNKVEGFNDADVKKGIDYLVNSVKSRFNDTTKKQIRRMTVSEQKQQKAFDRNLRRELQKNALGAKGKRMSKDEYELSYRKAVLDDKFKNNDFRDVIGGKITDNGKDYTISDAKRTGNYIMITMEGSNKRKVVKKIAYDKSAYNTVLNMVNGTKLTMDKIETSKPIKLDDIQKGVVIKADDFANEIMQDFDNNGAFTFNETNIKKVAKKYGMTYDGAMDLLGAFGTRFEVDGKTYNIGSKEEGIKKLKQAFIDKFGVYQEPVKNYTKKDPAGLGI